jgi:hypothetical protein
MCINYEKWFREANHLFSRFLNLQFNVFDFGKFIKTESMECHERGPPYRFYFGEIFLFEKCLIYTKKSEGGEAKALLYRDKFKFGPSVTFELRQDERTLTMVEGTRAVSFTAKSIEKILKFNDLIRGLYDPRKSSDSAFFDFVAKPSDADDDGSEQYKKDQSPSNSINNRKDKSFEDAATNNDETDDDDGEDVDDGYRVSSFNSEYEYDNFKSDSEDDDGDQNDILQISNSRFYVQSD